MITIEQIKNEVQEAAKEYAIKKVELFGSHAEGTHTNISNIDILVEFTTPSISLLTLAALKYKLEEKFKKEVDIVHGPLEKDSLLHLKKVISIYEQ
ncbi:nucleotidyltransferase domain-containing protein [Sedimentibacter sp.]|uniref:nucleotidyltransferase family protein n=1 Tax=Sedimentibacter sp. TaxID=1960295 RepID=UPI0028B20C5E|nr:nucleotidyltransferase domain-containing protein [Sedimentibacter sp.]